MESSFVISSGKVCDQPELKHKLFRDETTRERSLGSCVETGWTGQGDGM